MKVILYHFLTLITQATITNNCDKSSKQYNPENPVKQPWSNLNNLLQSINIKYIELRDKSAFSNKQYENLTSLYAMFQSQIKSNIQGHNTIDYTSNYQLNGDEQMNDNSNDYCEKKSIARI